MTGEYIALIVIVQVSPSSSDSLSQLVESSHNLPSLLDLYQKILFVPSIAYTTESLHPTHLNELAQCRIKRLHLHIS